MSGTHSVHPAKRCAPRGRDTSVLPLHSRASGWIRRSSPLQQSVKQAAVKRVARAGSVAAAAGDCERRRLDELSLAINRRAVAALRQADYSTAVTSLQSD